MPEDIKLRANTDAESVALIEPGFQNSIFYKRPHMAVSDFALEKKINTPIAGSSAQSGQNVAFDIEKEGTVIDDVSLQFTIPALTIPVDGTYARYQDCGLAHIFNYIEFIYSSTTLYRLSMDELFSDYQTKNDEKKRIFDVMTKTNLTPAQRNTLATAPQTIRIKLNTLWKGCGNQLALVSLSNKLRIAFRLNDAAAVVQTDGTKPLSLNYTDIRLVYNVGHIPGRERIDLSNMALRPDGVNTMFTDVIMVTKLIRANELNTVNAGYELPLTEAVGAIRHIRGFLRTTEQVSSTTADTAYYEIDTSLLSDFEFEIKGNERRLFERTQYAIDQPEYNDKYYQSGPEQDHFYAFWDVEHDNPHFASGHINLANFAAAKLVMKKYSNHPDLELTLLFYRWNWTNLKNGNYQVIWS